MLTEDQKQAILVLRENGKTYDAIAGMLPMFPLTVDGLEEGMKKLLSR